MRTSTTTLAWAAALAVMSMRGPFTTAEAAPARAANQEQGRPVFPKLKKRLGFNDTTTTDETPLRHLTSNLPEVDSSSSLPPPADHTPSSSLLPDGPGDTSTTHSVSHPTLSTSMSISAEPALASSAGAASTSHTGPLNSLLSSLLRPTAERTSTSIETRAHHGVPTRSAVPDFSLSGPPSSTSQPVDTETRAHHGVPVRPTTTDILSSALSSDIPPVETDPSGLIGSSSAAVLPLPTPDRPVRPTSTTTQRVLPPIDTGNLTSIEPMSTEPNARPTVTPDITSTILPVHTEVRNNATTPADTIHPDPPLASHSVTDLLTTRPLLPTVTSGNTTPAPSGSSSSNALVLPSVPQTTAISKPTLSLNDTSPPAVAITPEFTPPPQASFTPTRSANDTNSPAVTMTPVFTPPPAASSAAVLPSHDPETSLLPTEPSRTTEQPPSVTPSATPDPTDTSTPTIVPSTEPGTTEASTVAAPSASRSVKPPVSTAPTATVTPAPVTSTPPATTSESVSPQTSIPSIGTNTLTTLSVPVTLHFDPTSSTTPGQTSTGLSTASSSKPTAAGGLPVRMPGLIQPATGIPTAPSNFTLVQVGFHYGLNYPFVVDNADSAAQIFAFLPEGIAHGLGIPKHHVMMNALLPYNTSLSMGYVTTLAQTWIPAHLVNQMQVSLHTPASPIYHNPKAPVKDLLNMINPTIPMIPGSSIGGAASSASPDSATPTGEVDGAPIGGDAGSSKKVTSSTIGIGAGAVAGAAVYAAAMMYIARRYRQKRKGHQRISSVQPAGQMTQRLSGGMGSLFMSGANGRGSPRGSALDSAGRDSRTSHGSGNGRSIREQGISAPLMSENSLGWN